MQRSAHLEASWTGRQAFDAIGGLAADVASDLGDMPVRIVGSNRTRVPDHRSSSFVNSATATWVGLVDRRRIVPLIDTDHVDLVANQQPAAEVSDLIEDLWHEVHRE